MYVNSKSVTVLNMFIHVAHISVLISYYFFIFIQSIFYFTHTWVFFQYFHVFFWVFLQNDEFLWMRSLGCSWNLWHNSLNLTSISLSYPITWWNYFCLSACYFSIFVFSGFLMSLPFETTTSHHVVCFEFVVQAFSCFGLGPDIFLFQHAPVHKAKSIKKWFSQLGSIVALTWTPSNTFGMKWNTDYESDFIGQHQGLTWQMLLWLNGSKLLQPGPKQKNYVAFWSWPDQWRLL